MAEKLRSEILREAYVDHQLRDGVRTFAVLSLIGVIGWHAYDYFVANGQAEPLFMWMWVAGSIVAGLILAANIDNEYWSEIWSAENEEADAAEQAPWDALSDMGHRELERVREQGRTA